MYFRLVGYFFLFLITVSCSSDEYDQCGDLSNTGPYDIKSMELRTSENQFPIREGLYIEGTPINKENLYIHILVKERDYLNVTKGNYIRFNFFKTAIACSPLPSYTDEVVKDIVITSDEDFSTEYAAGANLAPLFEISNSYSDEVFMYPIPLQDYIDNHYRSSGYMGLQLVESPSLSKIHKFKIQYLHDDNETFILETPSITFE